MNVQGPSSQYSRIVPAPTATRTPASAPATGAPSAPPARPAAPASTSETTSAVAREATFWDLLTPEERDFFAEQTAMGPLTYGPRKARETAAPGPLGQRIDVRG